MNYIVLDMEWNQPWPGSPSSRKVLPVQIRGEIIQIGAVRVTEDQQVTDEFQVLIKPKYYRHLNRRVSKLTGIKETRLKEEGIPFPEAMEQFRSWCGEDIVFLTWGFDDIGILRENLRLFGLNEEWTAKWYNAQMIFNAQTDGSNAQKALKTAMEIFGIEATRPARVLSSMEQFSSRKPSTCHRGYRRENSQLYKCTSRASFSTDSPSAGPANTQSTTSAVFRLYSARSSSNCFPLIFSLMAMLLCRFFHYTASSCSSQPFFLYGQPALDFV